MEEIRTKNLNLNIEEFNSGETNLKSLPPVIFVELTQNCNLNCFMCRSGKNYQKEMDMDKRVFNYIKNNLMPYASVVDLRGYGESTILKDIDQYIRETALTGARIRLVTNALSVKRSTWSLLMENSATVVVSVDSSNQGTMQKLGRGSYEKLCDSLRIGREENKTYSNKGNIYFNTVVSSVNLNEIPEIVMFAKSFDVKRITLFPVVANRDNPLNLTHRKHEIATYISKAQEIAVKEGVELRLGASLDDNCVIDNCLISKCTHPWSYCYIDYLGNIGYCDHLIGHQALMIGNIQERSFEEIWNGVEMQKLRSLHLNSRDGNMNAVLPHCNWCYKRRYIDFENDILGIHEESIASTLYTSECLVALKRDVENSRDFLKGRDLPYIL